MTLSFNFDKLFIGDFMEYRLGNNLKIKDIGETLTLECPNCGNKVKFRLFSNNELRLRSDFPFAKSGKVFFLVCPDCAAVYTVDEAKGKNFAKGEKLSIGDFDFKTLKPFKGNIE